MAEKTPPSNATHILRDIAERKEKRVVATDKKLQEKTENELETGRFDFVPLNSISEDYVQRVSGKKGSKKTSSKSHADTCEAESGQQQTADIAGSRLTADNYRQVYLEQALKEEDPKTHEIQEAAKKREEKALLESIEKKQADNMRFRAREIQNQIYWWQQQRGLGQYDDTTIGVTVDQLQRELAGIPQAYWPS